MHDSNHAEVKLDYTIDPNRENRYRVESYLFIPSSLGVNRQSYPPDRFYADVQAYIRLKTPAVLLSELAGGGPLEVVRALISRPAELVRDDKARATVSYELRLFGCIVRARIRDHVRDVSSRLASLVGARERTILANDLRVSCERFETQLGAVIDAWRAIRADVHDASFPRLLRETFQAVDEFVSLTLEVKLSELVYEIDRCEAARDSLVGVRTATRERIIAERDYRRGAGYSVDDENVHLVYRKSKLKKFVTSVLWLEITKQKEGRRLVNVGAAIAAGVAMLFAVLATIGTMQVWVINTSEFVVAAVITYMLKDRIKDWLKHFFARRLTTFLFDYNVKIRDPVTGLTIGRCREAMSYAHLGDVPDEVMELRRRDAKVLIDAETKPEVVIRYEKEVRLEGLDAIDRLHSKHTDINDILRISFAQFLQRAADPVSTLPLLDAATDSIELVPFRKVYHLNLIMVFRSPTAGRDSAKRVRVVFDKDAIQSIEEVK